MTQSRLLRPMRYLVPLILLASLLSVIFIHQTDAAEPNVTAAEAALDWLRDQQLENGGFPGFDGSADPGTTADAVYAFAGSGIHPDTVQAASGASAVDYLLDNVDAVIGNQGRVAKLIMAFHTAGVDPSNANEIDLIAELEAAFDAESGRYDDSLFNHALVTLGLAARGATFPAAAIDLFEAAQIEDGSWSFTGEPEPGTGDSNTTALVVQALVAAGVSGSVVDDGIGYLTSLQAEDGSIAFSADDEAGLLGDANSTALAIQAFVAAGVDPDGLPNGSALSALAAFQNESDAFHWRPDFGTDDNMLATVQAIPALLLVPLPIDEVEVQQPPSEDSNLEEALEPVSAVAGCSFYEITGHNVCGNFDTYWRENGGLKIFGFPLTESFMDDGVEVQYFERARLELHPGTWPENHDILQGRLGAELVELILSGESD